MTKEERDKREAEKRARMEGSPEMGDVSLPFSRATLLKAFWVFALLYPAQIIWTARGNLNLEGFVAGSVLFVACLLPSWFWATGRVQGLPIFPIFALNFLPSYVAPLWQGHSALAQYTANQVNTAAWTLMGFLLIAQLFWQQSAVRKVGVPHAVRMINLKKSENILIVCLFAEVAFELLQILLWQFGAGGFAMIRGFTTAAGRMGIFVFSYQMGQGQLKPAMRTFFLILLVLLIIQETASLILANVLPTLGIAFAAYTLGSGKVPLKALAISVVSIAVLHAGKFEMRAIYLEGGKTRSFADLPAYFVEWTGYGLKNLTTSQKELESQDKQKTSTAKERASLIQLLVQIQTMTPSQVPYLEGASYQFIPSLLVPRILSPEKAWAHTGNMILSLHYGILDQVAIFKTSVGFDPIMEAYANFGFLGVLVLAVVLGFFLGWATRMTIHVPMLSFGFLFGVQVIACCIGGWNTMGVLVTTIWQSFLALCGLSLFLMSKQNNPVWKYYALKLADKLKLKADPKLKKTLEEVNSVLQKEEHAEGLGMEDSGLRESPNPQSPILNPVSERHERPTRFVYGEKKAKQ